MILVTGATGNTGKELVKLLTTRKVPFRAMVRESEKGKEIAKVQGVEVVAGDFDDPDSILRALNGVERAFLLTNSTERAEAQQRNFVDMASRAGVKHVVKLSQYGACEDSTVRFLRYHAAIERAIEQSGMSYTFLRPNLYMQGLLVFATSIRERGTFSAAGGDAKISAVDLRDNAAVAAAALTEPGHESRTYTLTGPAALTHAEMAASLSEAVKSPVSFVDISSEEMRNALLEMHMPCWQADGLIEDYAHYRRGEAAAVTTGVQDATGQQPRPFSTFAHDYASAFSKHGEQRAEGEG
jgi:uncharacterized protein YbjT (DUF2867 family)